MVLRSGFVYLNNLVSLSQIPALTVRWPYRPSLLSAVRSSPRILSAIAAKLKRRSKNGFKGRHFDGAVGNGRSEHWRCLSVADRR